jgi:hypothetical protein
MSRSFIWVVFPVLVANIARLTNVGYERPCLTSDIEINLHGTLSSTSLTATVGILVFTTHANESDLNESCSEISLVWEVDLTERDSIFGH